MGDYQYIYKPRHEKTSNEVCFNSFDTNRAVQAQKMVERVKILDLESRGIVLSMKRVAKTKATAKLMCVFVIAYAKCWFFS